MALGNLGIPLKLCLLSYYTKTKGVLFQTQLNHTYLGYAAMRSFQKKRRRDTWHKVFWQSKICRCLCGHAEISSKFWVHCQENGKCLRVLLWLSSRTMMYTKTYPLLSFSDTHKPCSFPFVTTNLSAHPHRWDSDQFLRHTRKSKSVLNVCICVSDNERGCQRESCEKVNNIRHVDYARLILLH